MFGRTVSFSCSGTISPRRVGESTFILLDPVDEGIMILRNVDNFSVETAYIPEELNI